MKTAVCTIIAKNYLPYARVLMASVRRCHPEFLRIVILADDAGGYFDPQQEDFTLVPSTAVPLPQSKWFHFKYSILELSTGLKPYALEMLLDQYELDRIIYLDPDIKIYRALDPVTRALDQSDIVLTPHLTDPIDDDSRPRELDILQAGSYNLGFIALSNTKNVRSFLRWWQKNVRDQCVVDVSQGLFVDQKWIDLVPGMFGSVQILRDHPGLNIAYWNVHGRRIKREGADYVVNGEPLYFFHFSGFNPASPEEFSKHQNRFQTSALGDGALLIRTYAREVIEHGFMQCREWPCKYNFFADGTPIPWVARPVLDLKPLLETTIEDPFSLAGLEAFAEAWNETVRAPERSGYLTRLAYRIYQLRADLQAAMPDVFGSHWRRFLFWIISSGKAEYQLPEILLGPIHGFLAEADSDAVIDSTAPGGRATLSAPPGLSNELSPNGAQRITLSLCIYESRLDLHRAFPDPWGRDGLRYLSWLLSYGRCEYQLDDLSCQPFVEEWKRLLSDAPTPFHSWWHRTRLAAYSVSARVSSKRRSRIHGTSDNAGLAAGRPMALTPALPAEGTAAATKPRAKRLRIADADGRLGINAIGYVNAEMGVGEVVRTTIRAAQSAHVDTAVKRVNTGGVYRENDLRIQEDKTFSYPVNIIHVNADQAPAVLPHLGAGMLRDRYNIGYWCWELEDFPERFWGAFRYFDEIWTLSRFSQDAIAKQSPIPVIRIPPAVELVDIPTRGRAHFGLPDDAFLVLTAFDMASVFERKNPMAVVRAFVEALGDDETSHLVMKVSNGQRNPDAMRSLLDACTGHRVTIIDSVIDRADVYALFQACDCLISLHRSEGFGLTMAEAMYLGKPVVTTGYSGNMDFTTMANSFLVGYRLVPVPSNCDPYPETAYWAEPSIADAVQHLRVVRRDPLKREAVARTGRDDIRHLLSFQSVGQEIRNRLERLHALAAE